MCRESIWKNICSACEKKTADNNQGKYEQGWCHLAFHNDAFGSCGYVDQKIVQYCGHIEAFRNRNDLKREDWARIERFKGRSRKIITRSKVTRSKVSRR